jgi:CDP-diacylglycerol--glycerol-3-phosphate 3-phosphatidyltransferase
LAAITSELDRVSPCFEVPASRIKILESPATFYSTLKVCLFLTYRS